MLTPDLLLAIYASVLQERSAVYCSAPITSGRLYVKWLRDHGLSYASVDHAITEKVADHSQFVVKENVRRAQRMVLALRSQSRRPVIDPTSVPHVNGWRQADWLSLWERVIEQFAVGVVFGDGWQFSFGCSHEYLISKRLGLPTYSESGDALFAQDGAKLVSEAADEIASLDGPWQKLAETAQLIGQVSERKPPQPALHALLIGAN